jgi:hypothetical protein
MIELDQLPEDAANWAGVVVDFPRLPDDSSNSCPLSEQQIFDYVRTESADLENADKKRFLFARTALVREERFWLWEYLEEGDEVTYVWVQQHADGGTLLSLNSAFGLKREQFLLAAYYDKIDWS